MSSTIEVHNNKNIGLFNNILELNFSASITCVITVTDEYIKLADGNIMCLPMNIKQDGKIVKSINENDELTRYAKATYYIIEHIIENKLMKAKFVKMQPLIIEKFIKYLIQEKFINERLFHVLIDHVGDYYKFVFEDNHVGFELVGIEPEKPSALDIVKSKSEDYPTIKKSTEKATKDELDLAQFVTKTSRKKGKKTVINLATSSEDLLSYRELPSEDEQKSLFNGWCQTKYNGINCLAKGNYCIPLSFNAHECINGKQDEMHNKICKILFCKKCHNKKEVDAAMRQHERLVSNGNFTAEQIKADFTCRILKANLTGRLGNLVIHDFYGALENINSIPEKYKLEKSYVNKIFNSEIRSRSDHN